MQEDFLPLFEPTMSTESGSELFPEMALSLYCWTGCLHRALRASGTRQVFFLAREGQPLMRLFDSFQEKAGFVATPLYLEVSRRSTLLPSLAALDLEKFDTLFRQYRRMSLYEFLASLGLESFEADLADELGLTESDSKRRVADFPSSSLFTSLISSSAFRSIYETQRVSRRDAFMRYLAQVAGGELPSRLVVVDVGWKGTIQDNLFALLCRNNRTAVRSVTGYYVGLVGEGGAGPGNEKQGLLFSCIGSRTPGFHIFNENRSLFEVLLAADHGSVVSYALTDGGLSQAVRGPFDEAGMLKKDVLPVQASIFRRFRELLKIDAHGGGAYLDRDRVARSHARLVFRPTRSEIDWFSRIFHVENYGVFERSYFVGEAPVLSLGARLRFAITAMRRRGQGTLGFWPWRTLHERVGPIAAYAYATIRRIQN